MPDSLKAPRIAELYRHAAKIEVPEHIEHTILAEAEQQARLNARKAASLAPTSRSRWLSATPFWLKGLGFALVGGVGVVSVITLQQPATITLPPTPAQIYQPKAIIEDDDEFMPAPAQQAEINASLARIRALKSQGNVQAARQLALALRKQYPRLTLAADIQALTAPSTQP